MSVWSAAGGGRCRSIAIALINASFVYFASTLTCCSGAEEMRRAVAVCLVALYSASLVAGDLYMHNFRGSNNRLNEANAERNQGNRLFDSQNNNRGGYNVGDKTSTSSNNDQQNPDGLGTGNGSPRYGDTPVVATSQYSMVFIEGSEVVIEWTAQHGCAGVDGAGKYVNNCNYILQYTCDTDPAVVTDESLRVQLRDGGVTNRPDAPNAAATKAAIEATRLSNNGNGNGQLRGRHENEYSYWECLNRSRNRFLFLANQNLQGQTARFTRQNANGDQNGLECPEERDYYPYWSPTIWRDAAYLTDNSTHCSQYILPNSQNTNMKYKCVDPTGQYSSTLHNPIFQETCVTATQAGNNGQWRGFTHNLPAPECKPAPWSKANQLGNADFGLEAARYTWKLPTVDQLKGSGFLTYRGDLFTRCVARLRYNMSTTDFDAWTTSSRSNGQNGNLNNPIAQNPVEDVGLNNFHDYNADGTLNPLAGLRLAIDTDQFGRTFQDRSHVFYIQRRMADQLNTTAGLTMESRVHNLNVRGKRGNIVQTYPAVEYDFMPNRLTVKAGEFIHIQWTGSNTHNNGGGGGDGQTGDAGQGTTGTDRHNFVQMLDLQDNFPMAVDKNQNNGASLFSHSECFSLAGVPIAPLDCNVLLATAGHFKSTADAIANYDTNAFNPLQNTSPASFVNGVLLRFKPTAVGKAYPYMATRNNSFSNRSQKGVIFVTAA